jgi:hypothetical protein
MNTFGRTAVLALLLAAGVRPVAAQEVAPQACADMKDLIRYLTNEGSAYTDIIYFQSAASFLYDAFHSTAEANGVQSVPGLGDRAFTYLGGNGPGVVVAKGDKLFTIEFSGIGNGTTEMSSLLVLAKQAVGRVH